MPIKYKLLAALFIGHALSYLMASPIHARLIFTENWQSNTINLTHWGLGKDYPGMNIVNTPHRLAATTDKALIFAIPFDTWDTCPSGAGLDYGLAANYFNCHDPAVEIHAKGPNITTMVTHQEYWYAWSLYIPTNQSLSDVNVIFAQWHHTPDKDAAGNNLEPGVNPMLAFRIADGKMDVTIRGDADKITVQCKGKPTDPPNCGYDVQVTYPRPGEPSIPIQTGRWYDLVANIKWEYAAGAGGFTKMYLREATQANYALKVNYSGPNTYNNDVGPYLKFGQYIPFWRCEGEESPDHNLCRRNPGVTKTLYIDEIRIGDATSSLAEVSTGGNPGPTAPASVTITPTPSTGTATPSPIANPDLMFEAESGTIVAPFEIFNDYIIQRSEITNPELAGKAMYQFNVPQAGTYKVIANLEAANGASNSLFVNIDSNPQDPTMIWDIMPRTTGFENREVSWRGTGTATDNEFQPKLFQLNQGTHSLILVGREASVKINYLRLEKVPTPTINFRQLLSRWFFDQNDTNADNLFNILDWLPKF